VCGSIPEWKAAGRSWLLQGVGRLHAAGAPGRIKAGEYTRGHSEGDASQNICGGRRHEILAGSEGDYVLHHGFNAMTGQEREQDTGETSSGGQEQGFRGDQAQDLSA